MRPRTTAILAILLLSATLAGAQQLVYLEGEVRVYETDPSIEGLFETQDSIEDALYPGYELRQDYVVKTYADGFAEIVLPNGHILKLAANTEIKLEAIVERAGSGEDHVSVASGRLRSVAARLAGTNRRFTVSTPTAVGGVRGTDWVTQVLLSAAGAITSEAIVVAEGLVEFTSGGTALSVAAGQFADALGSVFQAVDAGAFMDQFYSNIESLTEQALAASQQIIASLPSTGEPEGGEPGDDEGTGSEGGEGDGTITGAEATVVDAPGDGGDGSGDGETPPAGDGPVDQFIADMADALGIEIGTISLDGETYSKVVAQPVFQIGPLRAGLYLPLIYSGDMFSPADWYKPNGNNEWSFGFDQDWSGATLVALGDLVGDIALKIKFIEWGNQRDDFFFKVGSLNTLTLGHGLLMRNYANDADFPAIRRIGFNLGMDYGVFGFEALTNDLAAPQIFGARVYTRPIAQFPLAIGLSAVTDFGPGWDLPPEDEGGSPAFIVERAVDPVFVNLALDLDYPIVEGEIASAILYGDVGGLLPYLRADGGGLSAGFQTQALYNGTEFRNYGIAAGVFGGLFGVDYRLEFRNYHGVFKPAFYDSNYERMKGEHVRDMVSFLQDPTADEFKSSTIGIYGEAGFSLFNLVTFEAGYMWPITTHPTTGALILGDDDELLASLSVKDGLIPLGITAGISYERNYFMPTLLGTGLAGATLFDEWTVMSGEIVYPVAPIMDIVATISTTILKDGDGNVIYENRAGELRPKWGPVISIETRIGGQ